MQSSSNMPIIHFTGIETALMLSAIKLYVHKATPKQKAYYHVELSTLLSQLSKKNKIIRFDLNMHNAPIILHALKTFKHADMLQQFLSSHEIKALHITIHKIQSYYSTNKALEITPKQLIEQLNHDARLAKHDFIKEALNDIFSGLKLNMKDRKAQYKTVLSALASTLISNNVYNKDKHSERAFFIINLTLAGLENEFHKKSDTPDELRQAHVLYRRFKDLRKKHYKYCTITTKISDGVPYKLVISPAHLDDCLQLIKALKSLINTKHGQK